MTNTKNRSQQGKLRLAFEPLDLSDGNLKRLIYRLAIPAVIGLSANAIHHTINAYFVGMLGAEAFAAVTICLPILTFIAAIGEGLGVGTAATVARLIGAKQKPRAHVTASSILLLLIPLGIGLTTLLTLWRTDILILFGATENSLPIAEQYLRIIAFGATLSLLQIVCDFIAISEGNTKFSMWTLIIGFVLNAVFDPIFIFVFDLGVAGAAYATMSAQLVVLAIYFLYFQRRIGVVRVSARAVAFKKHVIGPVIAIATPASLTTMVSAIAFTFVYALSADYGGDVAVAAMGIAMRFLILGTLPLVGFVLGAQALLSFSYGAKDLTRLRNATAFVLRVTSLAALAYGMLISLFAEPIAALFTDDPAVHELAISALITLHLAFPLTAVRLVLLVTLQATARPRLAGLVSLSAQGYLLIPALWVAPHWLGFDGISTAISFGIAMSGALSAVLMTVFFLENKNRLFGSPVAAPAE